MWGGTNWPPSAYNPDTGLLYVPANPEYYPRFVTPEIVHRFHRHWEDSGTRLQRLTPQDGLAYLDYKHPNRIGRQWFSDELADVLLVDEGLTPGAPSGAGHQAIEGTTPVLDLAGPWTEAPRSGTPVWDPPSLKRWERDHGGPESVTPDEPAESADTDPTGGP